MLCVSGCGRCDYQNIVESDGSGIGGTETVTDSYVAHHYQFSCSAWLSGKGMHFGFIFNCVYSYSRFLDTHMTRNFVVQHESLAKVWILVSYLPTCLYLLRVQACCPGRTHITANSVVEFSLTKVWRHSDFSFMFMYMLIAAQSSSMLSWTLSGLSEQD